MKRLRTYLATHGRLLTLGLLTLLGLSWLLLHRLASLTGGLSNGELNTAQAAVGWQGIYHDPFYLPLKIVRSVVFFVFPDHGQLLTRLPNVLFGALSVVTFGWLLRLWHGTRTAAFTTLLFATSAWTLHVSRLASFDVLYLWAIPTMLVAHLALQRRPTQAAAFYGSLLLWGVLLYIPGLVWLIILNTYWQKDQIKQGWQHFKRGWQRALYVLAGVIWLPLLLINLTRPSQLALWLGLPHHLAGPLTLVKQFIGVFVHLFIRGPQYPESWLGRAPLLDVFTLLVCLLGAYFYYSHRQVFRSRLLGSFFVVGVVLVAMGGPVGLSLLVPLLYIVAGTGIAYLLRDWLRVFPLNPLARGLGLGLVMIAIGLSCVYNLRAYFVAWPHNPTTQATFRYHP